MINSYSSILLFLNDEHTSIIIRLTIIKLIVKRVLGFSVKKHNLIINKSTEFQDNLIENNLEKLILNEVILKPIEFHQLIKNIGEVSHIKIIEILSNNKIDDIYKKRDFKDRLLNKWPLNLPFQLYKNELIVNIKKTCKESRKREADINSIYESTKHYYSDTVFLTVLASKFIKEKISVKTKLALIQLYIMEVMKFNKDNSHDIAKIFDYIINSIIPIPKTSLGLENFIMTDIS